MRVLIADDDADVREVLVESFRNAGFDVLEAANGLEALLCVKRDRPDAVVLDLMMPRLGGGEALKRIHAFNPGIRALVVTGAIDSELHRQATLAGSAADGATAVRSVLTEAPDIVLLDVYMPGLSGVGALPTIAALPPTAKVMMISGAANEDVLKRSLAFGAHDYVTKPFEISSLSRAIETALAMRRLETGPDAGR